LNRAGWAEDSLGHVPLEVPLPEKVLLKVEERLLVVRPRRPTEVRHLASRQLRLVLRGGNRLQRREHVGHRLQAVPNCDVPAIHAAKCTASPQQRSTRYRGCKENTPQ